MPFDRPSLPALVERAESDLSARLLDGEQPLRRSVAGVLARVTAGQAHMLYGYLDWLAQQPFPDTAEAEYLARLARIWGIGRKPAVAAAGTVTLQGQPGAVLPAGQELRRDDGTLYRVQADSHAAGATVTASVAALVAGQGGNVAAGQSLMLTSPVAGLQPVAQVTGQGITGGLDAEDDASLRARLLRRIQEPPHGGAAADYVAWALEVPGITRAWVYPGRMGAGTVGVAVVADGLPSGPIPDSTLLAKVQAHLEGVRPVTCEVTVFAPQVLTVPVTVRLVPDSEAVRAAVRAELRDLFARESSPGAVIRVSHLREAVSVSPGEEDHVLQSPTADIVPASHQMPVLGDITFATA